MVSDSSRRAPTRPADGTRRLRQRVGSTLCLLAIALGAQGAERDAAVEGRVDVADLHVVDCLLPGQVRQLGTRTYLTARRPIKTTAADCRIRGGEYVAYDRADYASALRVWMDAAQGGDPEAQTNVGEIFEKGLGTEPNYVAAAEWYRRAAEQGYTRAQFNLGTLYEQGLGVPENRLEALNWYRRAWGIAEDDLMFRSAAESQSAALRSELEQALEQKDAQLRVLRRQVEELQERLEASTDAASDARAEVGTLESLIAQLEGQREEQRARLDALPILREPATGAPAAPVPEAEEQWLEDVNLGRYYALLIGNEDYERIDDLASPLADVERARQILEERYGFTVFTIANGDNVAMMQAINDLNEVLEENDNLLLFYAGHGSRLQAGKGEAGYWLPSNAEEPPRDTYWVPNEFVTGHLTRLQARRILVVADSCYAGLLSDEPSFLLVGGDAPAYDDPEFLKFKV
ncbi:MAG: caspase family protein, partial [Pseudomonadales bacterium]|nr:caspase family protein [Pseudomonadales bacterium]